MIADNGVLEPAMMRPVLEAHVRPNSTASPSPASTPTETETFVGADELLRAWGRGVRPDADPGTVGYHLSALYSLIGWLSWERIVRAWEAAQGSDGATGHATGSSDLERIRAFKNTILGATWVESGEGEAGPPPVQGPAERLVAAV